MEWFYRNVKADLWVANGSGGTDCCTGFVGGVPVALGQGWRLGKGDDFVIEGDEYDTAFFDKGPKFMHYRPQTAVLTDERGSYVLVVNSDDKIERRPVHVSGMVENGVTIADGVSPSDRVVATAGAFLQVGESVKPVSSGAAAVPASAS